MRVQYVETLPICILANKQRVILTSLSQTCTDAARSRFDIQSAVCHRILDLAPPERCKLSGKLENWRKLDFTAFRDEVMKAFHADIPVKQRGNWEAYLSENASQFRRLSGEIATAERKIDALVYRLFDLSVGEITLLEASLAGPILSPVPP
jgi:hypothetical protein